jgi:Zn-dependent protease
MPPPGAHVRTPRMQPPSAQPPASAEVTATAPEAAQPSARRLGPSLAIGNGRLQIRVALAFCVLAAAPGIAGGAARMALCAALAGSSLLAHELGHALCAVLWGSRATVVLHVLGTHTIVEPRLNRGRELIATLMGPLVSIALGLLFVVLHRAFPERSWLAIAMLLNLVWGAANLLPVLPFDGGRALLMLVGDQRQSTALLISGVVALVISVEGLVVVRSAPIIFLFGAAALASLVRFAGQRRLETERALELPEQLQRARALLSRGEAERARQLATRIGVRACTNVTANAAWEIVAWAELEQEHPEKAFGTLRRIRPAADVDTYCLAAVEAARGQVRHAIGLLERARSSRKLCLDAIKLLIDLHVQIGALDHACTVASAELADLDPDDTRRVIETAFELSAFAPATKLAGELFALTGSPDDAVSHAYGLARLGDRTTAKRIFSQLVRMLSNWQMHKRTLLHLRELASRPDLSELIGPELSQLATSFS